LQDVGCKLVTTWERSCRFALSRHQDSEKMSNNKSLTFKITTGTVFFVALSSCGGGSSSGSAVGDAHSHTGSSSGNSSSHSGSHHGSSNMPTINNALIPPPAVAADMFSVDRVRATSEQPSTPAEVGAFRIVCKYSHMAYDDPIVFPNQPGRAHLHTFFGNTGTHANSTYESLSTTGSSTCQGGTVNRSAYWVPSVIDTRDGRPIAADKGIWYYKGGVAEVMPVMQPIPAGLKMIAGDASASAPLAKPVHHFSCYTADFSNQYNVSPTIPNCAPGDYLQANILFPQCWNGQDLDSPDHKSHMAYPGGPWGWQCPATHPVGIPEISLNIYWPVPRDRSTSTWRLSSDNYSASTPGGHSMHADWFDGWKPDAMRAWFNGCVRARADCHAHLLGNGQEIY
jgi:hypothetical protein